MMSDFLSDQSTLMQGLFIFGLVAATAVTWNFFEEALEKVFPDKPRHRTICKGIIILATATFIITTVAIPVIQRYIELGELSRSAWF